MIYSCVEKNLALPEERSGLCPELLGRKSASHLLTVFLFRARSATMDLRMGLATFNDLILEASYAPKTYHIV